MINIKRKLSSLIAAFALLGVVTVPSVANYVTDETIIIANAADEEEADIDVYLFGNTVVRKEPSDSSKKVTNNKVLKPCKVTKIAYTDNGDWYYISDYKGWVPADRTTSQEISNVIDKAINEALRRIFR